MGIFKFLFCKDCKCLAEAKKEAACLKKAIVEIQDNNIENYISEHLTVLPDGIKFTGIQLSRLFAEAFHDIVKDAENHIVMKFKTHLGDGIDVIVVKEGKLAPLDKLKQLAAEVEELNKKLKKTGR